MQKPWKRKDQNGKFRGWYVTLDSVQYPLGKDKDAAFDAYHKLMLERANEPAVPAGAMLVFDLLQLYLDDLKATQKKTHYETNRKRLQSFVDYLEDQDLKRTLAVEDLKPFHVTEWANSHDDNWSQCSRRGRMGVVKRACKWAEEIGHIALSPIRNLKLPKATNRKVVLSQTEYEDILSKVRNDRFKELLIIAWETGARPQELVRAEARHYQDSTWVFPASEGKGDVPRIIFLNDTARAIVERLNQEWPEGPVLRNTEGNPWNGFSTSCAFKVLEPKIGRKLFLGAFRHTFCDTGLRNGVNLVAMQHLLGHKTIKMLADNYSHMELDQDYLRKQAEQVRKK